MRPGWSWARPAAVGIVLACVPVRGRAEASALGSRALNLERQKAAVLEFLGLLASGPGPWPRVTRADVAELARGLPAWNRARFQGLIHDPAAVDRTLGSLGLLAALGPASVGSGFQAAQAGLLSQYAALLTGSSDPSLAQASGLLNAEAQAVAQGNAGQAQTLAQSFAGIAAEASPSGAQGSADDAILDAGLGAVSSYDWAALLEALGQAALSGLRAALFTGAYGVLAAVALSLVESALQGDFSQQNTAWAGNAGVSSAAQGLVGGAAAGAGQSLAQAVTALGTGQGPAGTAWPVPRAGGGAAGQAVRTGQGTAAGGVLVGAQIGP